MITFVIAFLVGVCSLQLFSTLPSIGTTTLILSISIFVVILGSGISYPIASFWLKQPPTIKQSHYSKYKLILYYQLLKIKKNYHYFIKNTVALLIMGFLFGFCWMWLHCHYQLSKALDESIDNKVILVRGVIASLPEKLDSALPSTRADGASYQTESLFRFEFDIQKILQLSTPLRQLKKHERQLTQRDYPPFPDAISLPIRVRITYQNPPELLKVGDEWELPLRLKHPRGFSNPGSFDKEKYFFYHRWSAEGKVYTKLNARKVASNWTSYPLDRMRSLIHEKITTLLSRSFSVSAEPCVPILSALVLGVRADVKKEIWEIFQNTGTAHLMAISGLHIGMVASFFYAVTYFCIRRLRLGLKKSNPQVLVPAAWFSAWMGIVASFIYALLSGFSVPSQRAVIMIILGLLNVLLRRKIQGWRSYWLAVGVVLILDPFSSLMAGFWLSFGAVGIILYAMNSRLNPGGAWWTWGRIHWVTFFGLLPLSFFFFHKASLVSPLANAIAIPWVSYSVVPFALLAIFVLPLSETVAGLLLKLSVKSLTYLMPILQWFSEIPKVTWTIPDLSGIEYMILFLGTLLFLAPRSFPGRWLGIVWVASVLLLNSTGKVSRISVAIPRGALRFTLLDVGQGLSAIVETRNHLLVFDTGPGFAQYDAGEGAILPFLRGRGHQNVDVLMISHGDSDHVGGMKSILKSMQVDKIISSEIGVIPAENIKINSIELCYASQHWEWDGVRFEVLHPEAHETKKRNDHSCVLKVSVEKDSVLLTGDIEAKSEEKIIAAYYESNEMLRSNKTRLTSTLMVVPHHGSKTSSSKAFIEAVNPQYALIPVGYRNPYGHPKSEIVDRYLEQGVIVLDTIHEGAIEFLLGDGIGVLEPKRFRKDNVHIWTRKMDKNMGYRKLFR